MPRLPVFLALLLLAACSADAPAEAPEAAPGESVQTPEAAPEAAPADTSIAAFFSRFQAAVRRDDPEAVAAMTTFPLDGLEADRAVFLADYYPSLLGEGDAGTGFRDRLLAASPRALEPDGEGGYTYQALVTGCGDAEAAFDCESAAIYTFRRDDAGRWRLADVHLAG